MPAAEFFGWLSFFDERRRKEEGGSGNLLAMEPDEMVSKLTGG